MNTRTLGIIGGGIALLLLTAGGWWFFSPLFIDQTVDEPFPAAEATPAEEVAEMSEEERAAAEAEAVEAEEAMPDTETDDPMPADSPTALLTGQFMDADSSHRGSGTATIYEQPEGRLLLRFEDFSVTNGPALHVLLSPAARPASSSDLGDYVDLGPLKGNMGNQNYDLPADLDPGQYQSVVIYCMPFHVIFATAPLS